MQWEIKNSLEMKRFRTLQEVADYLGYSRSYVSQKERMGFLIEGYRITKIKEPMPYKKRYSYKELIKRLELTEIALAEVQAEVNLLKGYY